MTSSILGSSVHYIPTVFRPRFYVNPWWTFLLTSVYLFALDFAVSPGELLTPFWARKLCHMGMGVIMMLVDTHRDRRAVVMIVVIGISSLVMTWAPLDPQLSNTTATTHPSHDDNNTTWRTWVRPLQFGVLYDLGITFYLLIVIEWAVCRMPMSALAPVFFADPVGAIVGKYVHPRIPLWPGYHKTVFGSLAVFSTTFASFYFYNDFCDYKQQQDILKTRQTFLNQHPEIELTPVLTNIIPPTQQRNRDRTTQTTSTSSSSFLYLSDGSPRFRRVVSVKTSFKLVVSFLATFMEAIGGKMDNLLLATPVILGWLVYHALHWGADVKAVEKREKLPTTTTTQGGGPSKIIDHSCEVSDHDLTLALFALDYSPRPEDKMVEQKTQ